MVYKKQDSTKEKLVKIKRVTKVTKGGKKLGFTAFVIVSDQVGTVSIGTAKSTEVPQAIKRAIEKAKKHFHTINIQDDTIPHEVTGEFKASKVIIRPAPEGTGVIAGGSVRILLESLGLENVVAKSIGSNNSLNMAKAALNGLLKLKSIEAVKNVRGIDVKIRLKQKEQEVKEDA